MKDWIKHIMHTHVEKKNMAWCGHKLGDFDWSFISIDHAAYATMKGDRLVPCRKCVAAVKKALDEVK